MQIATSICNKILEDVYPENEKIPSIRTLAVDMQVNPNTVQRTYEYLQQQTIIFTQRGLGYFVAEGAKNKIKNQRKKAFLEKELPHLFRNMELLEIDIKMIEAAYERHQKNKTN